MKVFDDKIISNTVIEKTTNLHIFKFNKYCNNTTLNRQMRIKID